MYAQTSAFPLKKITIAEIPNPGATAQELKGITVTTATSSDPPCLAVQDSSSHDPLNSFLVRIP
jgi:hypothetical protein